MTVNYSAILKTNRTRPSTVQNRSILTESESDRGRILFCAAFRRLQQKAQVFSMEPNAAVRSRLTHSLEVSQIGRYIADTITTTLEKTGQASSDECFALVTFVESACLMHDIGNPPFGHFGEAAISKWFRDNGAQVIKAATKQTADNNTSNNSDSRDTSYLSDFFEFDGNPQGLRVVARLQWNKDEFGLNLTSTTLAAYLKYIRMAGQPKNPDMNSHFLKKAGYFISEEDVVKDIWRTFEYEHGQRFPLAYIMEAADDIAYCISDLEDSMEKGLVLQKDAFQHIKTAWDRAEMPNSETNALISEAIEYALLGRQGDEEYTFTDFRTSLNRTIVRHVANRYLDNQTEIFSGTLDSLLPETSGPGQILAILKDYCKKNVYCHESVQRTELAGYTAIYGLLNHFKILLECSSSRFLSALNYETRDTDKEPIVIEKKFLALFPERYIKVYRRAIETMNSESKDDFPRREWNARAHLIVDFVSGMTDDFAMTTYQTLSGMRL
jgi:dGTPase